MEEMTKHGQAGLAAMRAGMDPKTARKYVRGGKLPSELVESRGWRTHEDAFLEHWPELEAMLADSPAFEAKTLVDVLVGKDPDRYDEGQLRTLQRRVKSWRAERGPDKDVVLAQLHRPGEAAQTDFTLDDRARDHERRRALRAHAAGVRAALLQLALGEHLLVGVHRVDPARCSARALSARPRASVSPDGQLHRGDAPDSRRQEGRRRGQRQAASGRSTRSMSRSCATSA